MYLIQEFEIAKALLEVKFTAKGKCRISISTLQWYRMYPAITRGFCPSRMTSNN